MKKRNLVFIVLLAILLLGVGYAVVSSVTLTVDTTNTTVTMTADPSNFDVQFINGASHSGNGMFSAGTITNNGHTTTFTITGFSKSGDSAVVTLPFQNKSTTLKASLANATVSVSNTEYFSISATSLAGTTLDELGGTTDSGNLVLTITAIKTPVSTDETTTVTASLVASPSN